MLVLTLALGCAAVPTSGELGRLEYGLLPAADAADRPLVTGHPAAVWVALTPAGEAAAGDAASGIRHAADRGALTNIPYDDAPADFRLVVAEPGVVAVTSLLDGELFDRVTLRFEAPTALEVATAVSIGGGDWIPGDHLGVGDRLALSVAAVDADGVELGGELDVDVAFDPPGAFARDPSAAGPGGDAWIAAAAGPVSVSVIDPASGVEATFPVRVTGP